MYSDALRDLWVALTTASIALPASCPWHAATRKAADVLADELWPYPARVTPRGDRRAG